SFKKLLPVQKGEKGLMQSKALFGHIRQFPYLTETAFSSFSNEKIKAVGVSARPRNQEGSYMPVFLAGINSATSVSASNNVPLYKTSHQIGHILAGLYSCKRLDLISQKFIAFHISGGTTEALLLTPDEDNIISCEIVAKSLDLKIGQAIDRAGVMMGLSFPAGKEIDKLAQKGKLNHKPKPTVIDGNCSISGLENKFNSMFENGENKENISRFIIEYVYQTIEKMTEYLKKKYGNIPFLYVGGVMSNSIIKERFSKKGGLFCEPEFSSDNAAGIAIYSFLKHKKV
ncbi:MAG: peptidase M22, partial [Clostridia bacterium]|nr:peptidase M22 [Clostridia bacterium]